MTDLLIFGAGYSGLAIAAEALRRGLRVAVATRGAAGLPAGAERVPFAEARPQIEAARAIVATAPPGEAGDPVLAAWGEAIAGGPAGWIGYLSTTGVYGDRQGGWVDETTPPAPGSPRAYRRLAAEQAWRDAAGGRPLDIIRLAGIYGPGRSVFDDLRAGHARLVIKPGHAFGRIHRDDIARGVLAALTRPPAGTRVLNFADDEPAESAAVLREACRLLEREPPPALPFAEAYAGMSPMAQSFWAENRKVANAATKQKLAITWHYPSYREGLRAILAENTQADGPEG